MPELPRPPRRSEIIARQRAAGARIAAVLPIHQPRALFRAHGFLPVEVWGPPQADPTAGARHVQAYVCSIVRHALGFVVEHGLDVADLIVVPHACDSLQGLGSLLLDLALPPRPVATLYLPRQQGAAAQAFLADELRALARRLVELGATPPDPEALHRAIDREVVADERMRRLWDERLAVPLDEPGFWRLVRSREYLPAEDFTALADQVLAALVAPRRGRTPVVLSGLVPEPAGLLQVIEDAGITVVADDMACSGRRLYPPGDQADPYARLAEQLLGGPPDSSRGSAVQARADHLISLAARTGARAVVFALVKFCEPELFYLPRLRRALDEQGVRSLVLELDIGEPPPQQVATRLEALVESLGEA